MRTLDKEVVKERYSISEVIGSYTNFTPEGQGMRGSCPLHSDSTPSLMVYPYTDSFYCYSCQWGGDVINFIETIEQLSFPDAISFLSEHYDAHERLPRNPDRKEKPETLSLERREPIYQALLNSRLTDWHSKAHDWMTNEKGIKLTTLRATHFNVCWLHSPELADRELRAQFSLSDLGGSGLYNQDGKFIFQYNRLLFPFMSPAQHEPTENDSRITFAESLGGTASETDERENFGFIPTYIQGRNTERKDSKYSRFMALSGLPKPLYNQRDIQRARSAGQPLYIAEGITDTLSLVQEGYFAVGVLGSDLRTEHLELMRDCELVLAFDGDKQDAIERACAAIVNCGLDAQILDISDGLDITEYFMKERLTS